MDHGESHQCLWKTRNVLLQTPFFSPLAPYHAADRLLLCNGSMRPLQTPFFFPMTLGFMLQTLLFFKIARGVMPQTPFIFPMARGVMPQTPFIFPMARDVMPQTPFIFPMARDVMPQTPFIFPMARDVMPQTPFIFPMARDVMPQTFSFLFSAVAGTMLLFLCPLLSLFQAQGTRTVPWRDRCDTVSPDLEYNYFATSELTINYYLSISEDLEYFRTSKKL